MSNLWSDFLNDRLKPVRTGGVVDGVMDIEDPNANVKYERYNDSDDSGSETEQDKCSQEKVKHFLKRQRTVANTLSAVEDDDDDDGDMSVCYETLDVPAAFTKYNFDAFYKKPLPIDNYRPKILNMIQTNTVVIIHGPTGCGKTTQVPQYILNDCKTKNIPCNIVVTQPRRIAAMTVARRVCEERGWALGSVCGYQVGLDKHVGEDVILTYMTTEVLLQKIIQAKNLTQFTHIIIDEVHERNKTVDFLLLIVKQYLDKNSPNVRVILMSATMEAKLFSHYFRSMSRKDPNEYLLAPILHINKKSEFITNIFYNEHISFNVGAVRYDINSPTIELETFQTCVKLIEYFDKIDEINPVTNEKNIGSVLVFLPGYHEIEELHKLLHERSRANQMHHWDILPLHSSLSTDYLNKAFEPPRRGVRKIILSTNIAESSVTVTDVYYVIDFCLTKLINVNQSTRFTSLHLEWASHNNCIQRAGRVGRVSNGRVYRLVPQDFYENQLSENTVPELQRAPLENIILYMKLLDLDEAPKTFLSLAINPPNMKDIEGCIWRLKEIGALLQTSNGRKSQSDGDLTFIGRVMGNLPLDIHLSKLIILGHMFSCLDEAVIMAAGASIRNLFIRNFYDKFQYYRKKLLCSDSSKSDFISLLNLYEVWNSMRRKHEFRNPNAEYGWCRRNFISYKGLREWELLVKDINNRLKGFGIESLIGPLKIQLDLIEKSVVLKVMICGAFYPHYFIRSTQFGQIDVQQAVKILNGRDPFRTVYLTNMKSNQPGHIYVRQIKKMLTNHDEDNISSIGFDQDSCKIFIEYANSKQTETITVNGNKHITTFEQTIPTDVYEAVRKRQLRIPLKLNILPECKAWEFEKEAQCKVARTCSEEEHCFTITNYNPLPPLDIEYLELIITHTVDPNHFYCQNYNSETTDLLKRIYDSLNTQPLKQHEGELKVDNKIYAALYQNKKLYRCKIIKKHEDGLQKAHILFIDYGNTQLVPREHIYHLPDDDVCRILPIAMCCTLSGIKPPVKLNSSALWSNSIINHFKQHTDETLLYGKVYSVVGDVVHLELYQSNPIHSNTNLPYNQYLIKHNLAEPCEESCLSKMDHELRVQVLSSENPNNTAAYFASTKTTKNFIDFDSPNIDDASTTIDLNGPFSPLEMKIHGIMQATTNISAIIENDSVNVVLLDDNPEDSFARLIVAGGINQSSSGSRVSLSDTTIMPNIPGLPLLMLLLFCPTMEPKVNRDGTKVVSVLCGLGFKNNTRQANYPLHDVAYINDIELTGDLIIRINKLRYIMNMGVACMSQIYDQLTDAKEIAKHQNNLKDELFRLLHQKHKLVDREIISNYDMWNMNECDDLEVIELDVTADQPYIWPMLWFVRLKDRKPRDEAISTNLDELSRIAKRLDPPKEIVCQMCNSEPLILLSDVRIHVMTTKHRDNLKKLNLN